MQEGPHRELMLEAVAAERAGHEALLAGDDAAARTAYARAAERYAQSWDVAPPGSYGRLVGRMKAAIIGGAGADAASGTLATLDGDAAVGGSPVAAYAFAVAALAADRPGEVAAATAVMRQGPPAFGRAADGLDAVARGDAAACDAAIAAIEADFAARAEHLTGVAIADTAGMIAALARDRGLDLAPGGPLRPPAVPA